MNFKHIGCMTFLLINGHTALANDALQEEKVPACDYHELVVNTLSTLNINATGNPQGMVQGDPSELKSLTYTCANGTLEINTKPNVTLTQGFNFTLKNGAIDKVTLNGSQSIVIKNLVRNDFGLIIDGSGEFSAEGKVEYLDMLLNGSAEVDLSGLHTINSKVTLNGAGSVQVNAVSTLNAEVNGAGTITYIGSPLTLNKQVNGSGTIDQE